MKVALKSMANGKFVCAENGGNTALIANRDAVGDWETFEVILLEPGIPQPLPVPVPVQIPTPVPTPTPSGADMIDLHQVTIYKSPFDIADWPITNTITSLTMHPTEDPARGLSFEFAQPIPDTWKWMTGNPTNPKDHYLYTVWAIANVNGTIAGAAFVQMWTDRPSTGAPILVDFHREWAYSSRWGELNLYLPQVGNTMGFFVSAGNARDQTEPTSVRERSNVVVVDLPAGDRGTFTF